jgi:hypothetical protein
MVAHVWLYALADAQRHTDVAIHHGCLVLNHQHLTVTPSHDNLPEFVRRVHDCARGRGLCEGTVFRTSGTVRGDGFPNFSF